MENPPHLDLQYLSEISRCPSCENQDFSDSISYTKDKALDWKKEGNLTKSLQIQIPGTKHTLSNLFLFAPGVIT